MKKGRREEKRREGQKKGRCEDVKKTSHGMREMVEL